MDTHYLFCKLHEHEMELKRHVDDEESDKKKRKTIKLKYTNIKDMEFEDEEIHETHV